MRWYLLGLLLSAVLLTACGQEEKQLLVFAGAGLKEPLEEIAEVFEDETGIRVIYNFAGCGQHLSQMELHHAGDVFIAGSELHADIAMEKGFIEEAKAIVYHVPVIAFRKTYEQGKEGFYGIADEEVMLGLGDPQVTAIGKVSWCIFGNAGIDENLKERSIVYTATVNELITHLEMGTIDASIVWEDLARDNPNLMMIEILDAYNQIQTIPGAVIKSTKQHDESVKFLDFLCSEEGRCIFKGHGFRVE